MCQTSLEAIQHKNSRIMLIAQQKNWNFVRCKCVRWTSASFRFRLNPVPHYSDIITSAVASQIIGVSIVCSTVCSGADRRNHQSSASLAFVRGIHWWPVDSTHIGPVTWKLFPFDDVIMYLCSLLGLPHYINRLPKNRGNSQFFNCDIKWAHTQRRHMSVTVSQITGNSAVHTTVVDQV